MPIICLDVSIRLVSTPELFKCRVPGCAKICIALKDDHNVRKFILPEPVLDALESRTTDFHFIDGGEGSKDTGINLSIRCQQTRRIFFSAKKTPKRSISMRSVLRVIQRGYIKNP